MAPGAGEFWAELQAEGDGARTTAVSLENVSTGVRYPLSYGFGRWTGGVHIARGARAALRATNALGATAKTLPFRYLVDPVPVTDPCGGTAATNTRCAPLSRGMVTFTLDDSGASQPTIAIPLMQRYGVKGTFFVVPAFHQWTGLARRLAADGNEFADHTMTHATLTQLTAVQLEDELVNSKQWIETNIARPVDSFASPSGAWNADVIAAAKRHFGSHRTTSPDLNFVGTDVFKLTTELVTNNSTAQGLCAKMRDAAAKKGWLVLTFHDFTSAASSDQGFTTTAAVFEAVLVCATNTPGLDVVTSRQGVAAIRCGSPP